MAPSTRKTRRLNSSAAAPGNTDRRKKQEGVILWLVLVTFLLALAPFVCYQYLLLKDAGDCNSALPPSLPLSLSKSRSSIAAASKNSLVAAASNAPSSSLDSNATKNPGGLILTSFFSHRQDPRHVGKYAHVLPTFENIYHFYTTVIHYKLHAIIFHDDASFDESFVEKYRMEPHVTFVRVDPPKVVDGEPVLGPNDFRYIVFDNWFKARAANNINKDEREYGWYMIADADVFFNRNPFPVLDAHSLTHGNATFVGSFDGGTWSDEKMRLQRKLFRKCYGADIFKTFRDEIEWKTRNGNCGLWAGKIDEVRCLLSCTAEQYAVPPVKGKGELTLCDMVTHDYCVHYGGCFPGSTKGTYDENKTGVVWGLETMGSGYQGKRMNLFGPPYGRRHDTCITDSWAVVHNRCNTPYKPPICFRRDEESGSLLKYHQTDQMGGKCKLDNATDLPLGQFPQPT